VFVFAQAVVYGIAGVGIGVYPIYMLKVTTILFINCHKRKI
jgi:hypothetical protein